MKANQRMKSKTSVIIEYFNHFYRKLTKKI